MWLALLLLSWFVEGAVGIWFCYRYWMFTQVQYDGGAILYGPGYAFMQVYNGFMSTWDQTYHPHRHPFVLTQEHVALFFIAIYTALHLLALVRGLSSPYRERRKLGVRGQPSGREIQRFEQVCANLLRARAAAPGAPTIKRPWVWRVRDDDQGMQMRFIGFVLVIDRGMLYSRHFPALLAHKLAQANSFDLITRSMYAILPPFRWSVFTLVGLPFACGPILFHLWWMKYWRDRVFAGDEYAARLGQRYALKRALDELRWVLDGGRATRGGRWLRETPYIEERIDRLDRYQPPSAGTRQAFFAAHTRLRKLATFKPQYAGMATTCIAAVVKNTRLVIAHIGDSRAYLIRSLPGSAPTVTRLTTDHTMVTALVGAGVISPEEIHTSPARHLVLRMLGGGEDTTSGPDVTTCLVHAGDHLVLCCDGLWSKLTKEQIATVVSRNTSQAACDQLVQLANEAGGEDNISAVVLSFHR